MSKSRVEPKRWFVIYCAEDDSHTLVDEIAVCCEESVAVNDQVTFFYQRKEFKGTVKAIGDDMDAMKEQQDLFNTKGKPKRNSSFHADSKRKTAVHCNDLIKGLCTRSGKSKTSSSSNKSGSKHGSKSKSASNKRANALQSDEAAGTSAPHNDDDNAHQPSVLRKVLDLADISDIDSEGSGSVSNKEQIPKYSDSESSSEEELTPAELAAIAKAAKKRKFSDIREILSISSGSKKQKSETFCSPLIPQKNQGHHAMPKTSNGSDKNGSSKRTSKTSTSINDNSNAASEKALKLTGSIDNSDAASEKVSKLSEDTEPAAPNSRPGAPSPDPRNSSQSGSDEGGTGEINDYFSDDCDREKSVKSPGTSKQKGKEPAAPNARQGVTSPDTRNSSQSDSDEGGTEKSSNHQGDSDKEKSVKSPGTSKPKVPSKKYRPRYTKAVFDGEYFLHKSGDEDVLKLNEKYDVYILRGDLADVKRSSTSGTDTARHLVKKIFTDKAIKECSLTGRPAAGKGKDNATIRPPLHKDGISAIFEFAKNRATKKGWKVASPPQINKAIADVLCEGRYYERLALAANTQ